MYCISKLNINDSSRQVNETGNDHLDLYDVLIHCIGQVNFEGSIHKLIDTDNNNINFRRQGVDKHDDDEVHWGNKLEENDEANNNRNGDDCRDELNGDNSDKDKSGDYLDGHVV